MKRMLCMIAISYALLSTNANAETLNLEWGKTTNYSIENTRGASRFHNDPYWSWTYGDANVWDRWTAPNLFSEWQYVGRYTHTWLKGTFNLPPGVSITQALLKDYFYDPVDGKVPINDNMYVWVNDSPNFIAYGGTTYFYRWGHSDPVFDAFANYSDTDIYRCDGRVCGRGDLLTPAGGWHIYPLNLSNAPWKEGENTIYILTEDDSISGGIGKMQLEVQTEMTMMEISIDIKPNSDPNCFNQNEKGVIPVAIFGNSELDVKQIDVESLAFQGLQVRMAGRSNKYLAHEEYVDDDQFLDLVVQFEDSDGWSAPGSDVATVTGYLLDGTPVEGSDTLCIVP